MPYECWKAYDLNVGLEYDQEIFKWLKENISGKWERGDSGAGFGGRDLEIIFENKDDSIKYEKHIFEHEVEL